jgi:hypothetical protein
MYIHGMYRFYIPVQVQICLYMVQTCLYRFAKSCSGGQDSRCAELLSSGSSAKQQSEPNYPDAYGATSTDMTRILCGLHPHFLPQDANHVTSTDVPFSPADENVLSEFRTIWMTLSQLVNRAQQAMLHGLRSSINDKMFSTLNKVFPASDLLQKYWQYLVNRIHSNCLFILKYAENWLCVPSCCCC